MEMSRSFVRGITKSLLTYLVCLKDEVARFQSEILLIKKIVSHAKCQLATTCQSISLRFQTYRIVANCFDKSNDYSETVSIMMTNF